MSDLPRSTGLDCAIDKLAMFFATWLSETSDLKQELTQGNAERRAEEDSGD